VIEQHPNRVFAGHQGVKRKQNYIKLHCFWPTLSKALEDYIQKCRSCATMMGSRNRHRSVRRVAAKLRTIANYYDRHVDHTRSRKNNTGTYWHLLIIFPDTQRPFQFQARTQKPTLEPLSLKCSQVMVLMYFRQIEVRVLCICYSRKCANCCRLREQIALLSTWKFWEMWESSIQDWIKPWVITSTSMLMTGRILLITPSWSIVVHHTWPQTLAPITCSTVGRWDFLQRMICPPESIRTELIPCPEIP
jgi:hypothetical protein